MTINEQIERQLQNLLLAIQTYKELALVQTRMGHSTHSVTMDIYAHVMATDEEKAALSFDAFLYSDHK